VADPFAPDGDILSSTVRDFAAATAARTPTPGGGSVAGVVGALGVALGEMAIQFTRGKKKFAEHEPFHAHLAARLERARKMFQDLVADDMAAYRLLQAAMKQADGPGKTQALQTAVAAAVDVPREMTKLALAVLEDLLALSGRCNPYLITDLVAGAVLAAAVAAMSDLNVRINLPQVADPETAAQLRRSSGDDVAKARRLLGQIEDAAAPHLS